MFDESSLLFGEPNNGVQGTKFPAMTGVCTEERFMFDFLKKKISGFIDGLAKKEESKPDALSAKEAMAPPEEPERIIEEKAPEPEPVAPTPPEPETAKPETVEETPVPEELEKEAAEPEHETPEPETAERAAAPQVEAKKEPPAIKEAFHPEKTSMAPPAEKKPVVEKPQEGKKAPAPKPQEKPAPPSPKKKETQQKSVAEKKPAAAQKPEPAKIRPAPSAVPKSAPSEPKPAVTEAEPAPRRIEAPKKPEAPQKPETSKPETAKRETKPAPAAGDSMPAAEKPRERLKLGIMGAVKSIITREVEISEKDVSGMIESLELELLEADVDLEVAQAIREDIMGRLVGARVPKDGLHAYVSDSIRKTLVDILRNEKAFDIVDRVEGASEKPLKIVFLGINGAGKTTTIAKVGHLLQKNGKKIVFAAADTFRAAAIEQMAVHAERLDVKMIKREYGSDPTSVAFDAVNYARAHGMDAVLIDTAGRQDTNISLINEMKKMDRVIKPDIKIYIGESIAGNAILEQVSSFNREIGIDAVILTKLDCDPKGGTMLSISRSTGVPIIYVGVGQSYDDLERFEPERIAARIVE